MGRLVDGKWIKGSVATTNDKGEYDRIPRSFLDDITNDHFRFTPEKDRYHLYVSYACPWAHRTLIYRTLKGLEDIISVSVVSPEMLDEGWTFEKPWSSGDDLYATSFLREIYQLADPHVNTSVTVPVLWDKKEKTIVNNESSQIIRIFNSRFNEITGNTDNFYPKDLIQEIDMWNDFIYPNINNGVYRTGFANSQSAYEEAFDSLFTALDKVEAHLENKKFLVGDRLTEADIRLYPTLVRFDAVYVGHFKCNKKRIKDYKNLSRYLKVLYEVPAFKTTTHLDHIKRHYYYSHADLNPHQIIPKGPDEIF